MAAIALLCEIIAQGGKASAEPFRHRTGYTTLTGSDLVVEKGIAQSVACVECAHPHDAEVIFEDGGYGFWCPEIGFVPVDRQNLVGLAPDLNVLVAGIADVLECKRRKATPVRGQTWRIGAIDTPAGDLVIYFHPRLLTEADMRDLETCLQREVRAPFRLILSVEGTLEPIGYRAVRLGEVVELDPDTGRVRFTTDPQTIVGVPVKSKGGHPNLYEDRLTSIFHAREQTGQSLEGRNEEARAILKAFREKFPKDPQPSLATVKRYVSEFRGGS